MKMRNKMAIILSLIMMFSMAMPVMAASPSDFTDITDNWSRTAIEAAITNGILAGSDNKIMPNTDLKRCEMAAIINRAFGASQKGDISKYTDISAGKWYIDEMAKAVKMGTFKGDGSKLAPEAFITRQEAFVVLARALKLTTKDYSSISKYSDWAQISNWAKPELSALVAAGYVNGSSGKLNPVANISRAEFAQLMYNVLRTYIRTAGTYTTVGDGNVMINAPGVTLKDITVKGDLIIGDGVGNGDVTLDNAKIEGRTIIRGGGKNSIHIINGASIEGTVVIDNVNNEVRIVTDNGTSIEKIEAGSQVVLEGSFGEVTVIGGSNGNAGIEIKGNIQTLIVEAKADIAVTSGTVSRVEVAQTAGGTNISTAQGSTIETITANTQTSITGSGTVTNVEANANDVTVDTLGTIVTAEQGVTGVTAGGNSVAGGTTATTAPPVAVIVPPIDNNSGSNTHNISLSASDFSLIRGTEAMSTITVDPSDAILNFSSENTDVATIDQTTGKVTGVSNGKTVITVSASKSGYTSKTKTYEVTVEDVDISAVSDKMKDGVPDPDGSYSYIDIDVFGDYYLAAANDQKEGFSIITDDENLSVQSAEIHGGSQHAWIRVTFTQAIDDFTDMHIYYNQLNNNPIFKLDSTVKMPSFELSVSKVMFLDSEDYVASSARTYGPEFGTDTFNGNVIVSAADVTLRNLIITGNLTFSSAIGDGDAVIENVNVEGKTIVNGGGSNSIHIRGTSNTGVIEVNDQRDDQTNPINISAEGTGSIEAINNLTTSSGIKITPVTDSIGYVVAVDGSTTTYGDADNIDQLFSKIIAKANDILDSAITGTTDADIELADLSELTEGVIDTEYGIWSLKYYINPLDGVAEYQDEYNSLEEKLVSKGQDMDFINLRDNEDDFTTTMYDQFIPDSGVEYQGPDLGLNQGAVNNFWNTFSRFIAYKGYIISDSEVIASDEDSADLEFIATAQTIYDKLNILQNISVVHNIIAIDADASDGLSEGDRLEITFKRRLNPDSESSGQAAVAALIKSDSRFGSDANVEWGTTKLDFYGEQFDVSKCIITIGSDPNAALLGGNIIIHKDKLGSYIPEGYTEVQGQYGAYITDLQPLFDIVIDVPGQMIVSHIPAINEDSIMVNDCDDSCNINKGDSIEFAFTCKLSQASISEIISWIMNNDIFGTGTKPGEKIAFVIPDENITRLMIQLGNDPAIVLGDEFILSKKIVYDLTGTHAAEDMTIVLPETFKGSPVVQSISVIRTNYDAGLDNALATGDIIALKFDKGLSFNQMDGISLAFAEAGNVFGIPTGVYENWTQVPDVNWISGSIVAITLQAGFTLSLAEGTNTVNCIGAGIAIDEEITEFTDGVSNVTVSKNDDTYDVYVTFFNALDANNLGLRDALASALGGARNDDGSSGSTVKITGVAGEKLGTKIDLGSNVTSCGILFSFILPSPQTE